MKKLEMEVLVPIAIFSALALVTIFIIITNLPENRGSYLNITLGRKNLYIDW